MDDAVKGERMKAELITNVSHDLKTPLTSIISYVELLKHEDLKNERAKGFIAVLYEKSYRLKHLIEDLIEASKASSGNLAVAKMRVDYKQLTLQAMGELEVKTNAAGLTFKLSCDEPVFIDADGGHMWRILENLLSNVIKYAMRNSRIYVDIFKMDGYGVLVMKNISATPIGFDETRLTERFVLRRCLPHHGGERSGAFHHAEPCGNTGRHLRDSGGWRFIQGNRKYSSLGGGRGGGK